MTPDGPRRRPPRPRFAEVEIEGRRVRVRLPLVVEVEVNSRCNRACSYCPVSIDPTPAVPRTMAREVFARLVHELASFAFDGRLSYHFYSEPLLRRDLEDLIALARARVPGAYQVLYTNGDLLSRRRFDALREAGIDWVVVTQHDGAAFPAREHQTVLVPEHLVLTNRGGTLSRSPSPLARPCFVPHEQLVVTVTGDVLPCYEDATRAHAVASIMDRPLLEIWADPRLVALRERLGQGERASAAAICRACDNIAHAEEQSTWFAL